MKQSKIIISRASSMIGCLGKCRVMIDNIEIGKLANGKTIESIITSGEHTLSITWGTKITTISINVCDSEELFLFAKHNMKGDKIDIYSSDNVLLTPMTSKTTRGNNEREIKKVNGNKIEKEYNSSSLKNHNQDVKYILKGENGQLYVYENKIEITRKGLFAVAFQGLKGIKTIPISQIKSIQLKPAGLFVGYIQFAISGGLEGSRGVKEANYDENTVTFYVADNKQALEIKNYIEDIMLKTDSSQNTTIQTISSADELKKYKELLDEGIITQTEFAAKKKQLLNL